MQVFWMVMVVAFSMLLGMRIAYPRGLRAGFDKGITLAAMVVGAKSALEAFQKKAQEGK